MRVKRPVSFLSFPYCACALAGIVSLTAHAAAQPADQGVSGIGELQEVVVTATRRATGIQETPLSIDALSSQTLEQTDVESFNDIVLQIPALSAEDLGPGNKRYAIRNLQAAGEPEVGLYYDEIPIAGLSGENNDTGNQQPDLNLFDVERIEVLKGPQGTLYGEGSMGGTIRVISKRPDLHDVSAEVQANFADIAHGGIDKEGDAVLNVPIIDSRLAARLVGFYHDDGGYINELRLGLDHANGTESYGGRFSLRGVPTDNWTIDLIAYLNETHVANTFQQTPYFGKWNASDFTKTPRKDEFQGYNLISTTDFAFASLTVIGSYQQRRVTQEIDLTPSTIAIVGGNGPNGAPACNVLNYIACLTANAPFALGLLPVGDINQIYDSAWSEEVRLQSLASSKVKWTVGVFAQNRYDFNRTLVAGPTNPDGGVSIDPSTGLTVNSVFARQNWDPLRQDAVFGELSYPLLTTLDATAGARWTSGHRSDHYDQIQNFGDPAPYLPGTGFYPETRYSETAVTPKFELSYHPSTDYLYYILASEGFRLGGPNVPNGFQTTLPAPYKSDSIWNYELGYKTAWLSRRVTVDGALFWIDWNHIQETQTDPSGSFQFIGNGGKAVAKGAELEVNAQASAHLMLGGGLSYTYAALVGPQPAEVIPQNRINSGDRFPFVPNWTANGSATYSFQIQNVRSFVRGEVAYRSGQTTSFDVANPTYAQLPGFFLANARVGVEVDRYSAELYVSNIFDRLAEIGGIAQGSNQLLQIVSMPPRTVGLVLRAKL
jgi:iron complex outermembrane receptor protein